MEKQEGTVFNEAQLQYLRTLSYIKTPEALDVLNEAIAQYMAKKIDDEIDRLWDTGELTEEKTDKFRYLHERTPYK